MAATASPARRTIGGPSCSTVCRLTRAHVRTPGQSGLATIWRREVPVPSPALPGSGSKGSAEAISARVTSTPRNGESIAGLAGRGKQRPGKAPKAAIFDRNRELQSRRTVRAPLAYGLPCDERLVESRGTALPFSRSGSPAARSRRRGRCRSSPRLEHGEVGGHVRLGAERAIQKSRRRPSPMRRSAAGRERSPRSSAPSRHAWHALAREGSGVVGVVTSTSIMWLAGSVCVEVLADGQLYRHPAIGHSRSSPTTAGPLALVAT